jgi:antitoxin PrlF
MVRRFFRSHTLLIATLTRRGRITVPAAVREALGLEAGDQVEFVEVVPGRYELVAKTKWVTALKGNVRQGPKNGVDGEMNSAIANRGSWMG